jgi:hypothetical protein
LKSEGADIQDIVNDVKKNIIGAYNLYVNSDKAKEPVLQMLANAGEPFSKSLLFEFEKMVGNIDALAAEPAKLFREINRILGALSENKSDPEKKVRNFIHNSIRVTKESEKNYRERLKSKFEMIVHRISSILEKQASILRAFLPEATPLAGGAVSPQRQELSKEKLLMFMRTPAAQNYGLDNMDIMSQVLSYPESKHQLITLINAIDRGHVPADGPMVAQTCAEIRRWLDDKQKTNLPSLEQSSEKQPPAVSLFEEEPEE